MKTPFVLLRLFALTLALVGQLAAQSSVYNYTGGAQTYTVPSGTTVVRVKVWGAGGGAAASISGANGSGAGGGFVQADVPVTPGESLTVLVGQGGAGWNSTEGYAGASYPNGGGASNFGGGGGGRSEVYKSGFGLIGGGGGGGGYQFNGAAGQGGNGGGGAGGSSPNNAGGGGGTVSSGGAGGYGTASTGNAGGYKQGGAGNGGNIPGGSGGDGYYGGGAAGGGLTGVGDSGGGGGGGSNYVGGTGLANTANLAASGTTPPMTADADYLASGASALGNYGAGQGAGTAGYRGGNGRVVITPIVVAPPGPVTFDYSGGEQTYVVPAGVTYVSIKAWGAGGGGGFATSWGGGGGFITGDLVVHPGDVLRVRVGGAGRFSSASPSTARDYPTTGAGFSAYGGGGDTWVTGNGGQGGGRSEVETATSEIMIAGGGGGGSDGNTGYGALSGGGGGGGTGVGPNPGGYANQGGRAGAAGDTPQGGGGGGGWNGGGPGHVNGGGGGGSSGASAVFFNVKLSAGGPGVPGGRDDPQRGGKGVGGQTLADGVAGRVVITPVLDKTVIDYTGGDQTYTVGYGVTKLKVKAWGAGGGGGFAGSAGGGGGFFSGTINVSSGQNFTVRVGGGGRYSSQTPSTWLNWPSAGAGVSAYGGGGDTWVVGNGGQGGGRTEVQSGSALLIAGGGGGASDGNTGYGVLPGGGGGGGAGGGPNPGGYANQGGRAGAAGDIAPGGGGGGGWNGGGPGHSNGGGGGGSSAATTDFYSTVAEAGGTQTPGRNDDTDRGAKAGGGAAGGNGAPGRAVIVAPITVTSTPQVMINGPGVTLKPRGTANAGIAWTENVVWRPNGTSVTIGNKYGASAFTDSAWVPDNGPGTYQYLCRVVDVDSNYQDGWVNFVVPNAASYGMWSQVYNWNDEAKGFVAVHMAVLPNGKVLLWNRKDSPFHGATAQQVRLWDPADPDPEHLVVMPNPPTDIFCAAQLVLADGRVMILGGHIGDNDGTDDVTFFDYQTNTFTSSATSGSLPKMNHGRWYPSAATLANGDVAVMFGTYVSGTTILPNTMPQVWQTGSSTWRNLTTADVGLSNANNAQWGTYPWPHLAPDGRLFIAGPTTSTYYLDTSGTGSWSSAVATSVTSFRGSYMAGSVAFAPGKILNVGGAVTTAEAIDLTATTPAWNAVATPTASYRRNPDITLLADGTVFLSGGHNGVPSGDTYESSLTPEIWNPDGGTAISGTSIKTGQWTQMSAMATPRYYHSSAALLPDGRVLVAGGGSAPADSRYVPRSNAEIFSPPYLFTSTRPTITTAPTQISVNTTFSVTTPNAAQIGAVNLIGVSAVTHSLNSGQRINRLGFSVVSGGLQVTAPANSNLCPPGYYLLFILNTSGTPSVAKIIKVN
jgi:hypothetical protein